MFTCRLRSSSIIAAELQRQGVQKGSHVAICGANSMADSTIYLPEKIRSRAILELIDRERCLIISGARVTETQMKTFRRLMPNNHFLSSYGLSEMAPVSITAYDDSEEKILHAVGKPIENIFPAEIEEAISEQDNIDDKFPLLGSGKIDSVALKRDAVEKIKFRRENLSAD